MDIQPTAGHLLKALLLIEEALPVGRTLLPSLPARCDDQPVYLILEGRARPVAGGLQLGPLTTLHVIGADSVRTLAMPIDHETACGVVDDLPLNRARERWDLYVPSLAHAYWQRLDYPTRRSLWVSLRLLVPSALWPSVVNADPGFFAWLTAPDPDDVAA